MQAGVFIYSFRSTVVVVVVVVVLHVYRAY